MSYKNIIADLEDVSSRLTNELTDRLVVCLECEVSSSCTSCTRVDCCDKLDLVNDLRDVRNRIDECIYDLL